MFQIEKMYSSANVARSIRFTEELFEELNRQAVRHGISFNLLVLQCCRYALDHMDEKETIQ